MPDRTSADEVLTINAVVMALTNVILDYALIFGKFGLPEMGIKMPDRTSADDLDHTFSNQH